MKTFTVCLIAPVLLAYGQTEDYILNEVSERTVVAEGIITATPLWKMTAVVSMRQKTK